MLFFMIIAVVFVGWCFYKYDRNGFGAPQMRGMTHSAIADYYRRAFLDDDSSMQEVFENHWGDDYGTDKWMQFEMRVLEYLESNGDVQAKERLALVLLYGEQWKNGVERLEKLANEGNSFAMLRLARFFGVSTEYGGKAYDPEKEVYWYRKAADAGSAEAFYLLHFNYLTGDGIEKDEEKAMQCLCEAMERGHQKAKVKYARDRYGNVMKETYDPYKVIELLKGVLLENDKDAMAEAAVELGLTYGGAAVHGIKDSNKREYENVEEALRYFHLAMRIDPDSIAAKWYRSLMINTGYFVDEYTENRWIRMENEILRVKDEV
ncbi:MAG: sel1 repeat family protein [Clostridia bacterium]|nr:sel1 repeat family protein [Clostridia bacterium]